MSPALPLLAGLIIFYWTPDIVNFVLSCADNVCIFTNVLDLFLWDTAN